jgi:hypothetical protein
MFAGPNANYVPIAHMVRVKAGDKQSFHAGFLLGLFFDLEDGATCSSETSVDFQQTTRRYIPEDGTLQPSSCIKCKETFLI